MSGSMYDAVNPGKGCRRLIRILFSSLFLTGLLLLCHQPSAQPFRDTGAGGSRGGHTTDLSFPLDRYPGYTEYLQLMHGFAAAYPDICLLDTIGFSVFGEPLLVVKISDHVAQREAEPVFFYSSSMHGDETTGYILMLDLIDYLLRGYRDDQQVQRLVDSIEIWINPLANPDGTYYLGGSSIWLATRGNRNNIDLNRNFPDPDTGDNPDGHPYQPETLAMMEFMKRIRPNLSANLHSGAEVVNYPWDTWPRLHPDDSWFVLISKEYADTVVARSEDYFTALGGYTNGFQWYMIKGGRQDYVTYELHGRELTIELSDEKTPAEPELQKLWSYNRPSLLNLMSRSLCGLTGRVQDAATGAALRARISVAGHDADRSYVYSDSTAGAYYRYLKAGTYTMWAEAEGYHPASFPGITVSDDRATTLNIELDAIPGSVAGAAVPDHTHLVRSAGNAIMYLHHDERPARVTLYDLSGRQVMTLLSHHHPQQWKRIELPHRLSQGIYLVRIETGGVQLAGRIILLSLHF